MASGQSHLAEVSIWKYWGPSAITERAMHRRTWAMVDTVTVHSFATRSRYLNMRLNPEQVFRSETSLRSSTLSLVVYDAMLTPDAGSAARLRRFVHCCTDFGSARRSADRQPDWAKVSQYSRGMSEIACCAREESRCCMWKPQLQFMFLAYDHKSICLI